MRRPIADPRLRRPLLALVLVLLAAVVGVAAPPGTKQSGAATLTPPPPPYDAPAGAQYVVTERDGTVTITFPSQTLLNRRGETVPLGGLQGCGSFGCFYWGIGWNFGYVGHEVIDGCTPTDWTCTFRYLDGSPTGSSYWSMVTATLGYTRLAEGGSMTVYIWSPATHAQVSARPMLNGSPFSTYSGDRAYLVRGGTMPTFADCEAIDQYDPPGDATCIKMTSYGTFYANVPLGSGPWIVHPYVTATTGLVANSPRQQFYYSAPPGYFGNANVVSVTDDVTVDLPYVAPGAVTTTTAAPTTTTASASTTTSVPGAGGGNAPPPPVVTAATAGSPGSVSGTIDGQPGATVRVTIAHHSGASCARQMTGTGVTTVGAVDVVIEQDGESPFTVSGPLPAGGWVYGTAASSSVGDCFAVATPPTTTAAATTTTLAATTTTAAATTTTAPATTTTAAATTTTAAATTTTAPATTAAPTTTSAPSTTPAGGTGGSTSATADLSPGDDRLPVGSQRGFTVGDFVRIGTGAEAEVRRVTGFGSIIVSAPLVRAHAAGTPIVVVAPPGGDVTAPVISVGTTSGTIVPRGAAATLTFACSDTGVGVESCGGGVASGLALDTATLGVHSLTIRAWDRNGNDARSEFTWTVVDPAAAGPVPAATAPAPGAAPAASGGTLPRTGSADTALTTGAILVLLLGALLVLVGRPRRDAAPAGR